MTHTKHTEHAKKARVATPCLSHHGTFGGRCLNCGYDPRPVKTIFQVALDKGCKWLDPEYVAPEYRDTRLTSPAHPYPGRKGY